MFIFVRAYPWHSATVLGCLLLAALAEGAGLSSLLPLLGLATQTGTDFQGALGDSRLGRIIGGIFATFGLQPSIGSLCAMIAGGMILKSGFILLAQKQVGYTVAHVATDLRLTLVRALLAARWEYYIRQPVGVFTNAFSTEAARAADAYLGGTTMIALLIQAALYIALAVFVSWQATLGAVVLGVLILFALSHLVRTARSAGARQVKLRKSLARRLTDVLYAAKPLKAMARETLVGPWLERETQRLNRAVRREVLSTEMLRGLQDPLTVVVIVGGLYIGLARWGLPLNTVLMLALFFVRTLQSLNKVQREYQKMAASESAFWSLRETINRAGAGCEVTHGRKKPVLRDEIALRDVRFSYGDHLVLEDVSLSVSAGQLTLLIGPSGAGKTSTVDLIVGLVRPQVGEVWIDNVPLSEIDLNAWRRAIGYVPQETLLLHENVFVNVTLGDPELTLADVEAALRAAGAWDFVVALPAGMETPLGERGSRLSGGQRQRIAIARALVHRPQLLILDEATASLDPKSEAAICATVQQLRGTMTIIAISHQPALLEAADMVYRLEDGKIQMVALSADSRLRRQEAG